MKKKTTIIISILCCITVHLYSQTKKGLLWEISGNGLREPSYLLGTNHAMHYDYFKDSIYGAYNAFNSVEQLIVESVLVDIQREKNTFTSDLSSIKIIENKPLVHNYNHYLQHNGFDYLKEKCRLIPFYDSLHSTTVDPNDLCLRFSSYFDAEFEKDASFFLINVRNKQTDFWMDKRLQIEAKEDNYSIQGLETSDELKANRVERFAALSELKKELKVNDDPCSLAQALVDYLRFREKNKAGFENEINRIYMEQDLNSFAKQIDRVEINRGTFALYDEQTQQKLITLRNKYSLDKRNELWMTKLPQMIEHKPSFIAVGISHLCEEKGLINLLDTVPNIV